MKTHGISVYPEVFKTADFTKVLRDSIVQDLKKRTNIDFEKVSYSEIRDVVTTIVHNQPHERSHATGRGYTHLEHREGKVTGRYQRK